jgi:hypothetical protein
MAVTRLVTLYPLSELEGSARERALDWLRDDNDFWVEERRATLAAFEKIFPITVKDWEYGYRNHISFTFDYEEEIAELSGIRLMKYLYNNYFSDLWKGKHYWPKRIGLGKPSRISRVIFDNCCPLTGYYLDEEILEPIFNFLKKPDETTFYDLIYDCLQSWIYACDKDAEYQQSEEALLEMAEANDYLFDEHGRIA